MEESKRKMRDIVNKIKNTGVKKAVIVVVIAACIIGGITTLNIELPADQSGTQTRQSDGSTKENSDKITSGKADTDQDAVNDATTDSAMEANNTGTGGDTKSNTGSGTGGKDSGTEGGASAAQSSTTNAGAANGNAGNGNAANGEQAGDTTVDTIRCTVEIRCDSISGNGLLTANGYPNEEVYAANPQILRVTVNVPVGSSAYDALGKACRDNGIQLESTYTPAYKSYYIEGIHYLYERMAGSSSGWHYHVNDTSPGYGSSSYTISDGDTILVYYSLQ